MSIKSNLSVAAQVLLWADVEHTKSFPCYYKPSIPLIPLSLSPTHSFSQAALCLHPSISSCLPVWLHRVLFGNSFFPLVAAATLRVVPSHPPRRNGSWVGKSAEKCTDAHFNAGWSRDGRLNLITSVRQCRSPFLQVQPSPLTSFPGQLLTLLLILNSLSALTLAGSSDLKLPLLRFVRLFFNFNENLNVY